MDPRVKITPEVQQIFTLTTQMEDNAHNAAAAYKEARVLADKVKDRKPSATKDALLKQLDAIAPVEAAAPAAGGGGGGGRGGRAGRGGGGRGAAVAAGTADLPSAARGATPGVAAAEAVAPNLANIGAEMVAAVQAMQGSEMPPTAAQLTACNQQQAAYSALMAKWAALRAKINPPATPSADGSAAMKK